MNPKLELLPDDLILQILQKLPLKSQIRFQCVSKGWLDMISNPNRADSCYSYRLNNDSCFPNPTLYGFFLQPLTDGDPMGAKFVHIDHRSNLDDINAVLDGNLSLLGDYSYKIEASSNGFLLLSKWLVDGLGYNPLLVRQYVIYNPFTKQTFRLQLLFLNKTDLLWRIEFHCEVDDVAPNLARFTVVSRKLEIEPRGPSRCSVKVKVYTSSDPKWREFKHLENQRPFPADPLWDDFVGFANGRLYLCSRDKKYLTSFDLNPNKLEQPRTRKLYRPIDWGGQTYYHCMSIFGDSLFLCAQSDNHLRVSRAPLQGGKWETLYSTSTAELGGYVDIIHCFHPRTSSIIFFFTFTDSDGRYCDFKSYDFEHQKLKTYATEVDVDFCYSIAPCETFSWPKVLQLH